MPLYEYKCIDCQEMNERHVEVDNRDLVWYCWCGGRMVRAYGVGGVYIR